MFSVAHLNALRIAEIEAIVRLLPVGCRVLDVGAGTGQQAQRLTELGFAVEAIDLAGGDYSRDLVFPVTSYDGNAIPFPDRSFDVVYSSNLLEHVRDPDRLHAEIRRVLARNGSAIHVVPTHIWRAWTTATAGPDAIVQGVVALPRLRHGGLGAVRRIAGTVAPRRHGERGNILSETWLYHPRAWRALFAASGFKVVREDPVGVFYTGNMLFGKRLSVGVRRTLASILGSACRAFVVQPEDVRSGRAE